MAVLEFDQAEDWGPLFTSWMPEIAAPELMLAAACPQEYVEDAGRLFIDAIGRDELTAFLAEKLSSHELRVFHGTRLSDPTLAAIRRDGLKPLKLAGRRTTLVSELQAHPNWSARELLLDGLLHRFGPGWERGGGGKREDGAVHVCLSRNALLKDCNHYLTHGAEVDNHIVRELFPDGTGMAILAGVRKPALVSFTLDFPAAESAANPFGFSYERLPFITNKFLQCWAFRLSRPDWSPANARFSDALMVPGNVPAGRLTIECLEDADLQS